MHKIDWRKLGRKDRENYRILAFKRISEGKCLVDIAKEFGCHRSAIYQWIERYKEGGKNGLLCREITGAPPKLSITQRQEVFDHLTLKCPEQFGFHVELWRVSTVRMLILRRFGVTISDVSVGRLLKIFGLQLNNKFLSKRVGTQNATDSWFVNEYPKVKKLARKENAIICFTSFSSIHSDSIIKYSNEVVSANILQTKLTVISAISSQGLIRFMVFKWNISVRKFIDFLERLIDSESWPVFLIVERHRIVGHDKVLSFADSTEGKLRIFFV